MNPKYYNSQGTRLILTNEFDKPLDNNLYYDFLSKYQIISFGSNSTYNLPIGNLPPSIKKIMFPRNYNLPLDNLPDSITTISLNSMNYPYNLNNLPNSLNKLVLFGNFADKLENLPESLTKLILILHFTNKNPVSITNLPNSIIDLRVGLMDVSRNNNNRNIHMEIPDSVENLDINSDIFINLNSYPSNLKYLTLNSDLYDDIYNFPEGLEIIKFKYDFIGQIRFIPSSVKKIIFDKEYDFIDDLELKYPNIIFIQNYHYSEDEYNPY